MADVEQVGNILIVSGDGLFPSPEAEYRANLKDILNATASSPVKNGSHDFWIAFTAHSNSGANYSFEDLSTSPRKLRGIVHMDVFPSAMGELPGYLGVMLQEVGHHWLVPANLCFNLDEGRKVRIIDSAEITRQMNAGESFRGPLLLGRDNSHWTGYFHSDGSPLDGMYYRRSVEDRYKRWEESPLPMGPSLAPIGLPPVRLVNTYNDLERTLIGALEADRAYPNTNGYFYWLEPLLTAPLDYMVGIFVAFSRNDYINFGFYRDHRMLAVQRTGQSLQVLTDLGPDYHPLLNAFNGIALRIVRRGNEYHFQARLDNPLAGCALSLLRLLRVRPDSALARLVNRSMWEDINVLPNPDPNGSFDRFRTLARMQVSDVPLAVGMIVKRWDFYSIVEGSFYGGHFKMGARELYLETGLTPERMAPGTPYTMLERERLYLDNPTGDAIIRADSPRLRIAAPYARFVPGEVSDINYDEPDDDCTFQSSGSLEFFDPDPSNHFNHDDTVDNAPKLIARAPVGDFAFGTSCRVERSIINPWGAGAFSGTTMWGLARSLRAGDMIVPENIRTKWLPDGENTFKFAFILAAKDRADITEAMIQDLEKIRLYWDKAFYAATGRGYRSDSTL